MRSKREDLILHFTTGERIIATVGEEYRFSTAAEAREYGERVREKMRSAHAEGWEP